MDFRDTLLLAGRILLVLIFAFSGVGKLTNFPGTAAMLEGAGYPLPGALAIAGAIAFLIVGSALIVLGWRVGWGVVLLHVFLVQATWVFHNPLASPQEQVIDQTIQLLKNLGLAGGLLVAAAGPGRIALGVRKGAA